MADFRPFAGMSQEETQQALVYLLAAILDKMPRTDANDRLITNPSEVAPAATTVSGTVSTTLNTLPAFGTGNVPTNAMPMHMANAGANFLYDRIVF